jgi:hypothetical protein
MQPKELEKLSKVGLKEPSIGPTKKLSTGIGYIFKKVFKRFRPQYKSNEEMIEVAIDNLYVLVKDIWEQVKEKNDNPFVWNVTKHVNEETLSKIEELIPILGSCKKQVLDFAIFYFMVSNINESN